MPISTGSTWLMMVMSKSLSVKTWDSHSGHSTGMISRSIPTSRKLRRDHLSAVTGIGWGWEAQGGREAILETGLGQQLAGAFHVMRVGVGQIDISWVVGGKMRADRKRPGRKRRP